MPQNESARPHPAMTMLNNQDIPIDPKSPMINIMDMLPFLFDLLLFIGLFLFVTGTFFFFVPTLLVKWNAVGNTWIGDKDSAEKHATRRRFFSADYAIFSNHRTIGGIMWGLSSLFLIIYLFYK